MSHHNDRSRSSRELSSRPYRSRTRSISPPRHHRRHRDDYDNYNDYYHHHRRHHRHHRDSRSRSRSRSCSRSRSPESKRRRHHHHHHHRHRHDRDRHDERRPRSETPAAVSAAPPVLPFNAPQLSKHDLAHYEPMFAMYLDIQKGLTLEDLSEEEVKGRWKSFVKRWNRGELAEGWYDPNTLEKARRSVAEEKEEESRPTSRRRSSPDYERGGRGRSESYQEPERRNHAEGREAQVEEDDEEDYGPQLPASAAAVGDRPGQRAGPTVPSVQDLQLRRELEKEDLISAREEQRRQHRAEIRSHRTAMKELEEEIAPRAEPGTHERRLEKRREAAAANREFVQAKRGGSPVEAVPDEDLMGGGDNDLEALKKQREKEQRKKNEREIRREEMLRARAAEREERLRKYRQKEEETMGWLKALAKQRFG
ncbi:hypothetical protein VTN00DRAFT_8049 [Thermoascus crustaceus]|uniref:uncharacterized protein n=1 Tax=Thermoascus crustaceus TaxID=5088 RepID=UPI003744470C